MIIDTHTHLGGFPSIERIGDRLRTRADVAGWRSAYPDVYDAVRSERAVDNTEDLLAAMDRNGVDQSLVQPTVGVPNDDVLAWASRHERLHPLAWVANFSWAGRWSEDPGTAKEKSEEAARTAQEALDAGFLGIGETCARDLTQNVDPVKIAHDFDPLMDVLEERHAVIQFPTGWTQFPGNLYYQDPLWIDEVAGRHPGVTIVLCKMGRGIQRFFDSAISVGLRNKNVMFDLLATTPEHLRTSMDLLGPERVTYATDWSYSWKHLTTPRNVHQSAFDILEGATDDPAVRELVLSENPRRIYGLS